MRNRISVMLLAVFLVSGCAITSRTINLSAPFDVALMKQLMEPGDNTIAGSALIRQQGGGVVTCAGNDVTLFPVMEYSTERMLHIYGSDQNGYLSFFGLTQSVTFEPNYPEYHASARIVRCDAQGMFEFDRVKDGEYYIAVTITWMVGYSTYGGHLMQRVSLAGGETKRVVLSP